MTMTATTASPTPNLTTEPRVVLHDIRWKTYEGLLEDLAGSHVRMTYDRGTLEIMSPSFKHEGYGKAFEHLIDILATESDIDHTSWGTATFRRPDLERGLEPDCCYYFGHWQDVAHEEEIRLENDPPPDLVIEIEISRSVSIDRMALYAAFSVPEVWRFDGEHLTVQVLNDGRYEGRERSPLFPAIPPDGLAPFLRRYGREPIRTWKAEFLAWVRERMGA